MTQINDAQLRQRRQAARKHGLHALENRGPESLTEPAKIERYSELKQLVATHPGRMELRQELAARAGLLVDIGMSELIRIHDAGESIWESPVIKRFGTYLAELRRILDSFPADDDGGLAADIIQQEMSKNDNT